MVFTHLVISLSTATIITLFFKAVLFKKLSWPLWIFFLISFLGTWIGGVWVTPMGPTVWNVHWLPFFFAGLIFALLLVATDPSKSHRFQLKKEQREKEMVVKAALGSFFWLLIILLIVGIIVYYLGYRFPRIQPIQPLK